MNKSWPESTSQRSFCFGRNLKRYNRLPDEIIVEEILIRLPVESLLCFRLVCKRWNSLISDPAFASSHSNRRHGVSHDNDYLIIESASPRVLSIISRNNNFSENKLTYPNIMEQAHLIGSINGLVCVACVHHLNHHFILWNPAIRVSKIILLPTHWQQLYSVYVFGFAWDSVANDYKLLAKPIRTASDDAVVGVYSCTADCWTYHKLASQVNFHLYTLMYLPPSVIVKGTPYWKLVLGKMVLKFEVTSNEFKILNVLSSIRRAYNLVNLNDCLGRIDYSWYKRDGMEVEVSRYDEECSVWCKMQSINLRRSHLKISIPMCFKFGGEIVLFDQKGKLYDPKSNETKNLFDHHHKRLALHGFSYTPSMIAVEGMKSLQT